MSYIYIYVCMEHPFLMFLDHTQRRSTVGRTPLDEWSARRRDLYLTTHDTHNRQISMPPVGFEPTISAGERPQTYAIDRAATETGNKCCVRLYNYVYILLIIENTTRRPQLKITAVTLRRCSVRFLLFIPNCSHSHYKANSSPFPPLTYRYFPRQHAKE